MTPFLQGSHPLKFQLVRKSPGRSRLPPIDVCFVTEELPRTSYGDALDDLRKQDMQAFTYKGMITNAKRAYQEYIEKSPDVSKIEDIIRNIT